MKRFIYAFMAMVLCVGISASCQKEPNVNDSDNSNVTEIKGRAVHFGAGAPATKTEYGTQNTETHGWPVYWTAGDDVLIYSPNASTEGAESGIYTIATTSETEGYDYRTSAELIAPEEPIIWKGDDTALIDFYATYPSTGVSIDEDGIATFPINFNQTCDITADATSNQYTAEPNMQQNAYMVAKNTTAYTESVGLQFSPIMTTLDIVVNGPTESGAVLALTGISLTFQLTNKVSDTEFKYDIVNGQMVDTGSKEEVMVFIGINDIRDSANPHGFIDLTTGQSVKLTVMLPPNAIGDTKTAKIRIHAQAKNNTSAINKTLTIGKTAGEIVVAASAKRAINLPNINPVQGAANAWMTPLDDDIYVSQLSIPGTHDAGTGKGTSLFNAGQTQDFDLTNQLNIGIRFFDLRPAWRHVEVFGIDLYNEFWIYHGITSTEYSLKAAFDEIVAYLNANPGEFALVIMRHEDETPSSGKDTDKFVPNMKSFLDGYSGYTIPFRADLTVGECRKKIIVMSRTQYTNGPVGAYISSFPGNESTLTTGTPASVYNGNNTARLEVNDYYSFSDQNEKLNRIKALMDRTATHHTNPALVNEWVINHCSGYRSNLGLSTTNAYRKNAEDSNQFAFDYLTGTAKIGTTSYTKPVGSVGIVVMDFAGTRQSGSGTLTAPYYQVHGDLLPQAIIDNNYKFPMAKKPSAGQ